MINSTTSTTLGSCNSTDTSTGSSYGNLTLVNDGWPSPSWQYQSGVTGTGNLTQRAIPDVSFFAGDSSLFSATLICLSAEGACTYSDTAADTAQEVGGTSVGTPEMAGVMALIDQRAGAAQGLANKELYALAALQTYSGGGCSAETVKNTSTTCYFQDIDSGPTAPNGPAYTTAQTNSMPCNLTGTPEGGDNGGPYTGYPSPNCAAINSVDYLGTLVTTTSSPTAADAAYNSSTGYDLATGLGSLNVYNVVNKWVSDAGTASSTLGVTLNPTGVISADTSLAITVTVTGSGSLTAPTGSIVVAGGGYSATGTLTTVAPPTSPASSTVTITIPASSLSPGSVMLTITYGGDSNYAQNSTTETVSVLAVNPTVVVTAPSSANYYNALSVTVTVSGPVGAPTPTGTVTLQGGGYGPTSAETLNSSGYYTFTIPADTLTVGNSDTLTANYSGSTYYASGSGLAAVDVVNSVPATPVITVTPTPTSIDSSQTLGVGVTVASQSGNPPTPTGSVTLTAGSYTSAATPLTGAGTASFTVPANSLTGTASGETDTITASYSGDANYASGTKNASETVTQSAFSFVQNPTPSPSSVDPGGTATVTITGNTSNTDYTGTFTLNSCTLTSSSVTSPNAPPTCLVTGTITYASGTPTGSGTATVSTTSAITSGLVRPALPGKGHGWLGAGGGAVLALLIFFGIPARRRSWRSMMGILVAMVALGVLSSCGGSGGGGGGGTTTIPGHSAGTYTFTVSGTGNPAFTPTPTTTFTLTVN